MELQISELVKDFPALFNQDLFDDGASWVALPPAVSPTSSSTTAYSELSPLLPPWAGLVGIHRDDDDPGAGYLGYLSVGEQYRRSGLGERLLVIALDEAKRRGYARVNLVSLRCMYDAAVRLYDRAGFVSTKEEHYAGTIDGLGDWAFDVTWLTLDMAKWAGALAPRGSVAPQVVIERPLPQGPFQWAGRSERIRQALAPADRDS